jgi:hypothetical protein
VRWQDVAGWSLATILASGAVLAVAHVAGMVRTVTTSGSGDVDGGDDGETLFSGTLTSAPSVKGASPGVRLAATITVMTPVDRSHA